jgi:hypothetical protein
MMGRVACWLGFHRNVWTWQVFGSATWGPRWFCVRCCKRAGVKLVDHGRSLAWPGEGA